MRRKDHIQPSELRGKMSDLFDLLTPAQRERFMQDMTLERYKKDAIIIYEGDLPTHLFCLISGKVKIYKYGISGRMQITQVIKPVQYFGYRAFFADQNYESTAAAFESSLVCKIPIQTIFECVKENALLGLFFIRDLSLSLGQSNARTVNLTQKHVRGRLAEAILFLKDSYGLEEDEATLSIYMSREDLANLSNMTTSNAIRTLSAFAAEKVIAIDGRKIKIIDMEQLMKISKMG